MLGNQTAPEGFALAFIPERKFFHYAGMASSQDGWKDFKLIQEETLSISTERSLGFPESDMF